MLLTGRVAVVAVAPKNTCCIAAVVVINVEPARKYKTAVDQLLVEVRGTCHYRGCYSLL